MSTAIPARPPLCFIVGCPRSGTYLLSSLLNSGGAVAVPTETHFVPLFQRVLPLAGTLRRPANRRRLVESIRAFLQIWLARAESERDFAAVTRHSLLDCGETWDRIAQEAPDYPAIVAGLFNDFARRRGATHAGDKSAFFAHVPLELMHTATGGHCRFLHVVRDGRDVALSWCRFAFGPRDLAEAAEHWAEHVREKRTWGRAHPELYLEVRYEDLIATPEPEMRRICQFLGIPYTPRILEFHQREYAAAIADSTTHRLLTQPLDAANQQKWRTAMSAADLANFEAIAGAMLRESGYSLTTSPRASAPVITRFFRSAAAAGSMRAIRVRLKSWLPAVLLIGRRFGWRLENWCNSPRWLAVEAILAGQKRMTGTRRSWLTRPASRP